MKKYLFFLVLPLLAFTTLHKFYLSVTTINYSEKDDALQITTRIFLDDLENVLQERYGFTAHLGTEQESPLANDYLEKYLKTKFLVSLDGNKVAYTFLGKEYDDDVVICYMELPNVGMDGLKEMAIENEILTDLFDEQQNVVHVKWGDKKRSFVLIKSDAKGMLKL